MRCLLILATALALVHGDVTAQRNDPLLITTAELGERLRVLAADSMEGRYPGTRGETRTLDYLRRELERVGAKPGVNGQWLQPVRVVVHDTVPGAPIELRLSGRVERTLEYGREITLSNDRTQGDVAAGGELVFAGYGIVAAPYAWDDLAGVDVRGRIVVLINGEPSLPGDTVRFNGVRASRYGNLTDKLIELEARGARGVLLVRPASSLRRGLPAGTRRIEAAVTNTNIAFVGSITDSLLATLLPRDAPPLAALMSTAARPGFRAVSLGVRLDVRFQTRPRIVTTHNVVAVVPGTSSALRNEHVVITSHWDAYGIGRPVNGDSIYNGVLDDGSGVTVALALARVFARNPQPRSLTFVFTFEEWGLLGAEAFVCQGPLAIDRVVANLNLDDGLELFGMTRDVAPLGVELSSLGATIAQVARKSGLRVSPDGSPQEGFFLRADNYPFARAGVPALYMALGGDFVDRPPTWGPQKTLEYLQRDYHKPSDDYKTVVLDLRGSQQFAHFVRDVALTLAQPGPRPQWLAGSEFSRSAVTGARQCR